MKNLKLNYPSAIEWMWNYCTYLGPFIASNGDKFDLGIHKDCAAIVFGNDPGDFTMDFMGYMISGNSFKEYKDAISHILECVTY